MTLCRASAVGRLKDAAAGEEKERNGRCTPWPKQTGNPGPLVREPTVGCLLDQPKNRGQRRSKQFESPVTLMSACSRQAVSEAEPPIFFPLPGAVCAGDVGPPHPSGAVVWCACQVEHSHDLGCSPARQPARSCSRRTINTLGCFSRRRHHSQNARPPLVQQHSTPLDIPKTPGLPSSTLKLHV